VLKVCGVVNNQIRKGSLLSLTVNFFNRYIFGKVRSKKVIASALSLFFSSVLSRCALCKVHATATLLH